MNQEIKKDVAAKRNSFLITTAILCFITGTLFLFSFMPPDPPLEGEGLLVDFGTDMTGLGVNETTGSSAPAAQQAHQPDKSEVITQNTEESVKVKDNNTNTKPQNTSTKPTTGTSTKPSNTIDKDQLYTGPGKNTGQTGASEGTSTYGGNQGVETGDPNGYQGVGSGIGDDGTVGWSLSGRSAKTKGQLSVEHHEIGDIRIKIYVDKNGRVTRADYERSGSTITDSNLINKSKEAAMKWVFNADPKAQETQIGYITFHFKLQ